MACVRTYTLNLNGKTFKVSSSNIEGEASLTDLLSAINDLRETDYTQFEELTNALNEKIPVIRKPDSRRNRDLPYLIKDNLKKLGVEMEVLNQDQWDKFCEDYSKNKKVKIDHDAKSFFLDGKIYVRQNGFKVEDSIHELSHLLLAVMKSQNFSKYQNFVHTMYKHPKVSEIASGIRTIKVYSDNYDLDFEEEAVVRYLEGLLTENTSFIPEFEVNGEVIDTVDFLNNSLKPVIQDTFGITYFPGIITFFKSLVKDIPEYGSTIFTAKNQSSIGYKQMKQQAIKSQQVSALINYYSSEEGGNLIQKGECV